MSHTIASVLARLEGRIDWERKDRSKGWRVDLEPVSDLMERLGSPERTLRFVHVAGSKGKGSVASLVGAALRRTGATVGIYGSPHVEHLGERIRIGAGPVDDARLGAALTAVLDASDAARASGAAAGEASWFDLVTAAGLLAFHDARCDWVVLEVGLGGRLDSTNVIPAPDVCVVTSIALEHTAILGDTHGAIAAEKGGIVKPGSSLVTGCSADTEAGRVLAGIAAAQGVSIVHAFDGADATFEAKNVRVARAVLASLATGHAGISEDLLDDNAIAEARLPGRMERRSFRGVAVILDGAHVPGSVAAAVREARSSHAGPCTAVVAIHGEKDARALIEPLVGQVERVVATAIPGSGVHQSAEDVAASARGLGLDSAPVADAAEALREAARGSDPAEGGWILVIGSLYLVGALRGSMDPLVDA